MNRRRAMVLGAFALGLPALGIRASAADWLAAATADAPLDRSTVIFDGQSPNKLACDTTLRRMPDGSWALFMLGGGDSEPLPENRVFLSRSRDEGRTWTPLEPIDLGVKSRDPNRALVPSEVMVRDGRATMFVATHDGKFGEWRSWTSVSEDSGRTWSALRPLPGELHQATFVRNHVLTSRGEILLPFQHYLDEAGPVDPRNGVLVTRDGGRTFERFGSIRITADDAYRGWAENNIVEVAPDHIIMLIRADRLGGVLYQADSRDGGRTWGEARPTRIPNPGSKATLYPLPGGAVALLHNPNPKIRHPLALWVSFDGMRTWPYRRILVSKPEFVTPEHVRGGFLNYPDGFVSEDGKYLHFAYDERRFRAIYHGAKLPEAPQP